MFLGSCHEALAASQNPGGPQQAARVKRPLDGALSHAAAALFGRRGNAFVFFCCCDDFFCGFHGDTDGFFAENVHAAGKEFAGKDVMQAVGPADVGAIQVILAVEQFIHTSVGVYRLAGVAFDPVCHGSGAFRDVVYGGDDAEARFVLFEEFGVTPEMRAGNATAAYDGEVDLSAIGLFGHSISFLSYGCGQ